MSIKIDGNEFLSAREASEIFSYSSDYVAKLCRENLVVSKRIGRSRFVEKSSLENFVLRVAQEERVRLENLRTQRSNKYRSAVEMASLRAPLVDQGGKYTVQLARLAAGAFGVVTFVLFFALSYAVVQSDFFENAEKNIAASVQNFVQPDTGSNHDDFRY